MEAIYSIEGRLNLNVTRPYVPELSTSACVQNCGTQPVSHPIGNGVLSVGVKSPELEANHSSQSTGPGAYVEDDYRFNSTQKYLGHL
jgi:hypothetical protein